MGVVASKTVSASLVPIDYRDEFGIMRRVLLPAGASPQEGIPISLPVDELYGHMPIEFRQRLMEALWARELVEPRDFLRAGAAELIRSAWLSVVKYDVMDIQNLAKENSHAE